MPLAKANLCIPDLSQTSYLGHVFIDMSKGGIYAVLSP